MKKVIAILALVALTGNIASAELLKNFKYDGQIDVNAVQVKNMDYDKTLADKGNDASPRVQINASFDLNDDVNAVVSAVKCSNRQYGDGVESVAGATADGFNFEQAYLNLKGVLGLDHKLGRQYYGNEGDLVIYYGPTSMPYKYGGFSTYGFSVTGLDGWTSGYKTGKLDLGFILAKVANDAAANVDNDEDVAGVTAKYDLMEDLKLGGYFYQYNEQFGALNGGNDTLKVVGVKADGNFKGFEYHGEVAKNMGTNNTNINPGIGGSTLQNDYTGMGFLANVKYGIDLLGKLTFTGEYAMGSGDDDNTANDEVSTFFGIASDYRPGIIWGGGYLTGLGGAGIGNLTTYNVGAAWAPAKFDKLTLNAKYFSFAPSETQLNGAAIGYDTYGTEFDLCATWKHSENVGVKAYYAMFMPDQTFLGAGVKDDSTSVLGTAFTVKF